MCNGVLPLCVETLGFAPANSNCRRAVRFDIATARCSKVQCFASMPLFMSTSPRKSMVCRSDSVSAVDVGVVRGRDGIEIGTGNTESPSRMARGTKTVSNAGPSDSMRKKPSYLPLALTIMGAIRAPLCTYLPQRNNSSPLSPEGGDSTLFFSNSFSVSQAAPSDSSSGVDLGSWFGSDGSA